MARPGSLSLFPPVSLGPLSAETQRLLIQNSLMDLTLILIAALVGLLGLAAASWKWCLPADRVGWIIAAATLLGGVAGWGLQWQGTPSWLVAVAIWAVQGVTYVGIIAWLFYRDPERVIS